MSLRFNVPTTFPWAIGTSSQFSTKQPTKVNFCDDKKVCVYKQENNEVRILDDVCPHRGASLSAGKIHNNCIQCPYHGWQFNGEGRLVFIPSTKNRSTPVNCSLDSYPSKEQYGLLWTNLYGEDVVTVPECPELDSTEWQSVSGTKVVEGNWIDWVCNSTDISHINYVHDFADEANGSIENMKVYDTEDSVVCEASVVPKAVNIFTEHMQIPKCSIHSEFFFPNTTVIKIQLKNPYEFITYTTVTPLDFQSSRITWVFAWNFSTGNIVSDSLLKNRFAEEMEKTIGEDEAIIQDLTDVPMDINVPCDMYQMKVLDRLTKIIKESPCIRI